jgi:hypothetical protein
MARAVLVTLCMPLFAIPTLLLGQSQPPAPAGVGPDLITGDLPVLLHWGAEATNSIHAYSTATTACNLGDTPVFWHNNDNQHPVISQNLFRLAGGRFEQIGQSWLKWTYASFNESDCETCDDPGTDELLGAHCSDTYSATFNGTQTQLGPKSSVNPFTGSFPQNHATPGGGAIAGRLQVHTTDLTPSQNPGALYFVEGQHVAADDAAAGNWANNASYRQVWVTGPYNLTFANPAGGTSVTAQMVPAIQAWQDQDASVFLNAVDIPNDGRIFVARKATALGGGQWHYELAVQNLNSDRAVGGLLVLLPTGAIATNLGFHDVDYHSGEVYSGTDWTPAVTAAGPRWDTQDYAANPNANALRWGTLYNFRFDANVPPPGATLIELRLFKPGTPTVLNVRGGPIPALTGDLNCDGTAGFADINPFVQHLSNFAAWQAAYPGCPPENGDINGDGTYGQASFGDINPFVALLSGGG